VKKADLTAIMATIGTFAVIGVVLLAVIGLLVWASNSAGKTQAPPQVTEYPYAPQVTEYPYAPQVTEYPYPTHAPDPVPTYTAPPTSTHTAPPTPPDDDDFLISPDGH